MVRIKFLRAAAGFAYFRGDVAELEGEMAEVLIEGGFARLCNDAPEDVSDLPVEIPYRKLLIEAGIDSLDKVRENADVLSGIKGIGDKSAKQIILFVDGLS